MTARKFAGLLPALLLAGCVNLGAGKPPARLLTLTAEATAPAGPVTPSAGTLLVIEPVTPRELAVTRVPVAEGAGAIAYLKDATWVERPARLFRSLLAETGFGQGERVDAWRARIGVPLLKLTIVGEPTLSPVLDKVGREPGLRVNLLSGTLSEIRDTPCGQLLVGVVASDVELTALPEIFAREGVRCEVLA